MARPFCSESCREKGSVTGAGLPLQINGGRQGVLMEEEESAAGENAVILPKGRCPGAVTVNRGAVLRPQVLNHMVLALARDREVPARKGSILNDQVRRVVTSNGDWLIADVPSLDHRSILT